MKIIFMGTPAFAVESLRQLVEAGYTPVAVVTAPDKPAGRGQQLSQSAVKKYALQEGIKVLQPSNLKAESFVAELRALGADLQVVVAFRMLPEVIWNMPRLGTYNLHASLLPKYRGAAPINWAIIHGETRTGVTTFRLRHEIDSGDVLFQEEVPIRRDMNAGELHDELMTIGASLLVKTIRTVETCDKNGTQPSFTRQDDRAITHAPKLTRELCRIDWSKSVEEVHNLVRGLSPHPAAFTRLAMEGKSGVVKIYRTAIHSGGSKPGQVVTDYRTELRIGCADGWLKILELQPEGRKRMPVADFLKGLHGMHYQASISVE